MPDDMPSDPAPGPNGMGLLDLAAQFLEPCNGMRSLLVAGGVSESVADEVRDKYLLFLVECNLMQARASLAAT